MNTRKYFHEFFPATDSLEHVGGGTVSAHGYGTIIMFLQQKLYALRDVAFMPENPKNTFIGSHLLRLNKFLDATHYLHSCIKLIDQDGVCSKIKITSIKNNLDYINLPLLLPLHTPSANLASHEIKLTPQLTPQLIHQKCCHFHYDRTLFLAKHKLIDGLPVNLPPMTKPCPICLQVKSHKLPRCPSIDHTKTLHGEYLHMDFAFMPQSSIRGFTGFLSVKDGATNYTWVFLTRNKRPPLDFIKYLFAILQKDNRIVKYVRVDEDKSLANCTEFCQLLHDNHVQLQGTGGYASNKNGKVESLNKSLKYATIAALTSANMPIDFWCFAMQHCNTIIRNMSLNPNKTKTSHEAWTNKKSNWKEFRIPFCDV